MQGAGGQEVKGGGGPRPLEAWGEGGRGKSARGSQGGNRTALSLEGDVGGGRGRRVVVKDEWRELRWAGRDGGGGGRHAGGGGRRGGKMREGACLS